MARLLTVLGRVFRGLAGGAPRACPDEEAWLACVNTNQMLEWVDRRTSVRKLRLFCVGCCRRIWDLLEDERSRRAVEVAERYADGLAGVGELTAAHAVAQQVSDAAPAGLASSHAARAAWHTTAPDETLGGTRAEHAPPAPAGDADVLAAWLAARAAHCALLRDLHPNPFRPVRLDPAWLTPTVTALAQGAYEERQLPAGTLDPVRLVVLADALEEAGCVEAELLGHLRGPGPHARGCWALDAVLGRS